jgi:hypothetical protein
MIRIVLGVVAGILLGGIVVGLVETVGHTLWPLPPGVDVSNPEQLKTLMSKMNPMAMTSVLVGWGAGTLARACAALAIAQGRRIAGWIVVAVLFAGAVWSMVTIPHPLWFVISSVVVTLAAALTADRLLGRKA